MPKVRALRSFFVGLDDDGNRDIIEKDEVREMSEKQFKELNVHGLILHEEEEKAVTKKEKKS